MTQRGDSPPTYSMWPGSHWAVARGDPASGVLAQFLSWPRLQSPHVRAPKLKPSVTVVPGRGTPPIAGREANANRRPCVRGRWWPMRPLLSCPPLEFGSMNVMSFGMSVDRQPPKSPRTVAAHSLPLPGPPRISSGLPTPPSPSPSRVQGLDGWCLREVGGLPSATPVSGQRLLQSSLPREAGGGGLAWLTEPPGRAFSFPHLEGAAFGFEGHPCVHTTSG